MAGSSAVPLVGRSAELGRALEALQLATDGAGGTVFLAGEPGIGKTRLATETLSLARLRGFVTLRSAAYPLQGDLAYAPVLEAFGPFLAGLAPGRLANTTATSTGPIGYLVEAMAAAAVVETAAASSAGCSTRWLRGGRWPSWMSCPGPVTRPKI